MYSLLLAIIYLAFISLGLPDSVLGSAWPVIHQDFNVPLSFLGIVTMIISFGTIISSLLSDRLTRKLKTGPVTAISVLLTAAALTGFSFADRYWLLCVWAVPYGLGAGAVDAALNNYVALHYEARHMSWLHCFWGVGTIVSPYIVSYSIAALNNWSMGYRIVSYIQFALAAVLLLTLPIWKKCGRNGHARQEVVPAKLTFRQKLSIKGVKYVLLGFFAYCAFEATFFGWVSSYLVGSRAISEDRAAAFSSLFFIGLTVSRFIAGLFANRLGDRKMIRIGIGIVFLSVAMIALPFESDYPCLAGFVVAGFGCGPIYPSIIHSTPFNFGMENSQAIIGLQMASAYTGSTFMPPLFGLIANLVSVKLLPAFILVFLILLTVMGEKLNRAVARNAQSG